MVLIWWGGFDKLGRKPWNETCVGLQEIRENLSIISPTSFSSRSICQSWICNLTSTGAAKFLALDGVTIEFKVDWSETVRFELSASTELTFRSRATAFSFALRSQELIATVSAYLIYLAPLVRTSVSRHWPNWTIDFLLRWVAFWVSELFGFRFERSTRFAINPFAWTTQLWCIWFFVLLFTFFFWPLDISYLNNSFRLHFFSVAETRKGQLFLKFRGCPNSTCIVSMSPLKLAVAKLVTKVVGTVKARFLN